MIRLILYYAHIIDKFLRKILGRPYQVILSVALIYEIIHRVHIFVEAAHESGDWWRLAFVILLGTALVINQLSDLYEHLGTREERESRRGRRGEGRVGKPRRTLEELSADSVPEAVGGSEPKR